LAFTYNKLNMLSRKNDP